MLLLPKLQESCLPSSVCHAPAAPPNQRGVMDRGAWLGRTGKQQQARSLKEGGGERARVTGNKYFERQQGHRLFANPRGFLL